MLGRKVTRKAFSLAPNSCHPLTLGLSLAFFLCSPFKVYVFFSVARSFRHPSSQEDQ